MKEERVNPYKLLRLCKNLTIQETADLLLVSKSYISEIESFKKEPSERLKKSYADTFGVSMDLIKTIEKDKKTIYEIALLKLLTLVVEHDRKSGNIIED